MGKTEVPFEMDKMERVKVIRSNEDDCSRKSKDFTNIVNYRRKITFTFSSQ